MENVAKTMQAVVVEGVAKVSVREVSCPVPLPGEVLIRIDHCLLCTWEQRMFGGSVKMDYPFIPGHEVSGEIVMVPEATVTSFTVGLKVTVKTLDSCGHCEACYRGDDNLCTGTPRKRVYDGIPSSGGLGQYICMPVSRVFALPDQNLDLRFAAFAEPLACCINSLTKAQITLGEDVVVVGAGIMGQFHIALAAHQGARVIAIEPDAKRALLARQMGAAVVIDPFTQDAVVEIKKLTQGNGAHVVFTTITQTALAQQYVLALAKKGRIIYYGSFHPNNDITLNPNMIHYSERVITGSYSPTSQGFWIANRLIAFGIIDVKPFLSAQYPLAQAQEAFEHSQSRDIFRVAINLWQ
ncbi:MAG: zinc-binding dehydrogenase [Sphaerochaetaceae bacterium]